MKSFALYYIGYLTGVAITLVAIGMDGPIVLVPILAISVIGAVAAFGIDMVARLPDDKKEVKHGRVQPNLKRN